MYVPLNNVALWDRALSLKTKNSDNRGKEACSGYLSNSIAQCVKYSHMDLYCLSVKAAREFRIRSTTLSGKPNLNSLSPRCTIGGGSVTCDPDGTFPNVVA